MLTMTCSACTDATANILAVSNKGGGSAFDQITYTRTAGAEQWNFTGVNGTVTECVACDTKTVKALSATTYASVTNCSAAGTAASPSVATCAAAPAGAFSCDPAATGATCTVNTTAAHTNSDITITSTASAGTRLSVTCNTTADTPAGPRIASISNGVSFTINLGTVTTNPACFFYSIIN